MKLLIYYGLCEGEKAIAPLALHQLLSILSGHEVDILFLDDATPSQVGERMAAHFADQIPGKIDVVRLKKSVGARGCIGRVFGVLRWVAQSGRHYDHILRVDADLHFCRRDLAALFEPGVLPTQGICGQTFTMRPRDFAQVIVDVLPMGFRRRRAANGKLEHDWQLRRLLPVWWHDFGMLALLRGFRGQIIPGSFIIISGAMVAAMHAKGWLDRDHERLGLAFGDDTVLAMATVALGQPMTDARDLLHDWSCEIFLRPDASAAEVKANGRYFIHPMKDVPWANTLREALPLGF